MKIFLSLFLFLSLKSWALCEFRPQVSKVVSLSGSSTLLLKDLGLLRNPKLKGISIFNPILSSEFSGKLFPGGIYLSRDAVSELAGSVVFYDESQELRKILTKSPSVEGKEIKTRNLTPGEAFEATVNAVTPYLQGCEDIITKLKTKLSNLEKELLTKIPADLSVVFYLGEFRGGRAPEMVIANDGVVKWLKDKKKINTYPSTLPYVSWSSRLLSSFPPGTWHVAIKDTGREGEMKIKGSSRKMTLMYPGALVPGPSQLEAILFWLKSL